MIMPLCKNGLKPCQLLERCKINLSNALQRILDCVINVEIAASINGVGVRELPEDHKRPLLELPECILHRLFRYVPQAGA